MSHFALTTEKLQKIASYLQKMYKGEDEVHEMIKSIVEATPVTLLTAPVDPNAVVDDTPVGSTSESTVELDSSPVVDESQEVGETPAPPSDQAVS